MTNYGQDAGQPRPGDPYAPAGQGYPQGYPQQPEQVYPPVPPYQGPTYPAYPAPASPPQSGPPFPGQPSGPPYAGQPSGPPYAGQPSAPPYGGQPSGPPYQGQPYQGPPAVPGQPAGPGYGAPPPKRGMMPWLIAGIVVLVLLGVGTAVIVATRSGQPTANPSASAGKSGSAGPSGTATPRPSSSGEIIAPDNSGYKFPVPAGFHSVSDHNTPGAGSVAHQSVVRLNDASDKEYLQVTVYSMTVDTDSFTDAQLEKILTDVYSKLSVKYEQLQRTDISHIRAFRTEVTIGSLRGVIVSAFRGKWQLEVLCQWQSRETDIRRGCYSILDSVEWSPSA